LSSCSQMGQVSMEAWYSKVRCGDMIQVIGVQNIPPVGCPWAKGMREN
jgi:hypothetical protein